MKLSKKITAKELLGKVSTYVKENLAVDEEKKAYAIAGIANGIETGVSTFGEWQAFKGDMQATIYHTGEVVRAPKAFIPEPLNSILIDALSQNDKIEFAFEVSLRRHADNDDGRVSYEYIVRPLTEVSEADSLAHLTKLIAPIKDEVEEKPTPKAKPAKKATTA